MAASLFDHYQRRKSELEKQLAAYDAKSDVISSRRGILALIAAVGIVFGLLRGLPTWGWGLIAAVGVAFGALVVRHAFVASDRALVEERLKVVAAGLRRIQGEAEPEDPFKPKLQDPHGARFASGEHPNSGDLDLFGPSSLFVMVSRAETAVGEETLASWLKEPAAVDVVRARQEAAKELLADPVLLEDLAVLSRRAESRGRAEEPLAVWGEAPAVMPVAGASGPELPLRRILVMLGRLSVPLTIGLYFGSSYLAVHSKWLGYAYAVPLVLQLFILGALYGPIARMVTFVSSREAPFGRFRLVFERIESCQMQSPLLKRIVDALRGEGAPASAELAKLEKVIGFADLRHNGLIHFAANLFLLYDVWVALALERWRQRSGKKARRWLSALGELEALASIAIYAGEQERLAWPDVDDGPARISAEELGHPLLPAGSCVRNDLELPEPGRALLVTGSNMSGKSTYLRSMGLCAVMALAGLPVCARRASVSRMETWTSMRIQDALDRGMSHFYAELVRLKAIVDAAHKGKKVLFLLDEILHGTNSHERSIGARGVVLDLVARGAVGAVSTHDFALVAIAEESGGHVRTVHFSDRIEEEKMVFDYKLREGVVETTNAIRLMKAVGIDVAFADQA
ncbi:MAG: DNA mismatch repair protein MutS [Polyangiaceae bacterium]|nr:DNA mismatch repair protein MutS [Polyangiaceae bacterium]